MNDVYIDACIEIEKAKLAKRFRKYEVTSSGSFHYTKDLHGNTTVTWKLPIPSNCEDLSFIGDEWKYTKVEGSYLSRGTITLTKIIT